MAGRIKIVSGRIRKGKVQRRRKVSNVEGYAMRDDKLVRMSASERRKRKMGARRGKIKRKASMRAAIRKRKRSMQQRKRLGFKE